MQARHGPQGHEVLNWLMGWSVLADADGVMGEYEENTSLAESSQANRRTGVVTEDEEGRTGRTEASVESLTHHHCTHGELADAVVDLPSARI